MATSTVRLDYLTPTYIYYYIEPPPPTIFNLFKQYMLGWVRLGIPFKRSISHFSAFVKIGENSCIPNGYEIGRVRADFETDEVATSI